ncbi:cytosine permease, partial [Streptomyces atratus]|uniref:cytosine permease n=1 Tax=Streptomyces atratus TaxID=1893 RepID=UPI0036619C26
YWYANGWNWRAVVAFAVGGILAIGGSHSAPGPARPTSARGHLRRLAPISESNWVMPSPYFLMYSEMPVRPSVTLP